MYRNRISVRFKQTAVEDGLTTSVLNLLRWLGTRFGSAGSELTILVGGGSSVTTLLLSSSLLELDMT